MGELANLLARIKARKNTYKLSSTQLIVDETGYPISPLALRSRFDKAREKVGIDKALFQFRDLRAKAGTDKEDREGIEAAKNQLGHTSESMTRHYVRHRQGKRVTPTK
jgi:integrase